MKKRVTTRFYWSLFMVMITIAVYLVRQDLLSKVVVYSNSSYTQSLSYDEKLPHDLLLSLLYPQINKSIGDYYLKYLTEQPLASPWFQNILNIQRIGDKNSFEFIIMVEAYPYIGPHNTVGIDHITFKIHANGNVDTEKFEHIRSFNISPNYSNIIKCWPPE